MGTEQIANGVFEFSGVEEFVKCFSDIVDNPDNGIADVTFVVGESRFGGLRKVLSTRCDVFGGMLDGGFKESCRKEDISLPQFAHSPQSFRAFLLFMHCGQASLSELPFDLHEIANYFDSTEIKSKCQTTLELAAITVGNALRFYSFGEQNDSADMLARAEAFIFQHADEIFVDSVSSANQMSPSLFRKLFQTHHANVSETTLFKLLLEVTAERQQELLPFIRFPLMPTTDLMTIVAPSGLIDKDTLIGLLAFQADPKSVQPPAHHSAKRRKIASPATHSIGTPLRLNIHRSSNKECIQLEFGKESIVADLKEYACSLFNLSPARVRIWDYFNKRLYVNLNEKLQETLDHCRIYDQDDIFLQEAKADGLFPSYDRRH